MAMRSAVHAELRNVIMSNMATTAEREQAESAWLQVVRWLELYCEQE